MIVDGALGQILQLLACFLLCCSGKQRD